MIWALTQEYLSLLYANNKDTDQPAHMGSLISTSCYLLIAKYILICYRQNFIIVSLYS